MLIKRIVKLRPIPIDVEVIEHDVGPDQAGHVIIGVENEPAAGDVFGMRLDVIVQRPARHFDFLFERRRSFRAVLDLLDPDRRHASKDYAQDRRDRGREPLVGVPARLLVFSKVHGEIRRLCRVNVYSIYAPLRGGRPSSRRSQPPL